jgi:hypothetical protein
MGRLALGFSGALVANFADRTELQPDLCRDRTITNRNPLILKRTNG